MKYILSRVIGLVFIILSNFNIKDNQHHHFSGLIIQLAGWEWVFYLQGGLALLWCLLWVLLVADSPDKHRWQRLKNNLRLKSKVRFWLFEFSDMKEQPQKFAIKSIVVVWGYWCRQYPHDLIPNCLLLHLEAGRNLETFIATSPLQALTQITENILRFISSEEAEYIAASQPKQVQSRWSQS